MKEENELRKKYGAPNPFTVPEGYFENLAGKVMEQLPEKESQPQPEVTMWERVRPWVYMAAMFCGLMFGVRVMVNQSKLPVSSQNGHTETFSEIPDEYIDPIVNQTMMDDYTLYQYLTDANTEIYQ